MKLKGKPYREYMERRKKKKKRFKTSLESMCCGSWPQWDSGDSTCLVWCSSFFFIYYSSFIPENRCSDTKLCNLVTGKDSNGGKQARSSEICIHLPFPFERVWGTAAGSSRQSVSNVFLLCLRRQRPRSGACGGGLPVAAADWHAVLALPAGRDVLSASAVATECENSHQAHAACTFKRCSTRRTHRAAERVFRMLG